MGCGLGPDRLRAGGHAQHEGYSGRRTELLEWMVESLHNFLDGIIGHHLVHKTFWFFATIFIFILFSNWSADSRLRHGRMGSSNRACFEVQDPLFRGANADLNMTLAMALIFFLCWIVWAFQEVGPIGFLLHLFAPKGDTTGFLKVLMVVVFFAVAALRCSPFSSGRFR